MIEIAKNKADDRKIQNIDYTHSTIFDEKYKMRNGAMIPELEMVIKAK